MAPKDLLPGYVDGLRGEIEAAEALGARPLKEWEGDPRVRDEGRMRLEQVTRRYTLRCIIDAIT